MITVKLDSQLGRALRQYKADARININDLIRRALICYWLDQKTQAASVALNIAERQPDESWAAYLEGDGVEVYQANSELAQALHQLACEVAGVKS